MQGLLSAYLALQLVSKDSISDHPLPQSLRITCMQLQDSVILLLETNNLLLIMFNPTYLVCILFGVHLITVLLLFVFMKDVGCHTKKYTK